ncbi:hypothetical protein [Cellulomonas sp. PhB143]|uniref:hypothetical protein n=1 Tax=Cellulomonas sp. PhB143 TaxID=2485186 RepID=UPI000F498B2C|nr:hypothetical protein [Cellulomonas sp. PhB143]ROS73034.1 hypothetical protein EDF32_2736 [Cellulomonas sp. PhB143]
MTRPPQWEWLFVAAAATRPSPVFTNQYDAEQWLGEHWRSLAAEGVVRASLMHDGAVVTAPVELPADGPTERPAPTD